eukprot:3060020-Prymnesium_polylepis.1
MVPHTCATSVAMTRAKCAQSGTYALGRVSAYGDRPMARTIGSANAALSSTGENRKEPPALLAALASFATISPWRGHVARRPLWQGGGVADGR